MPLNIIEGNVIVRDIGGNTLSVDSLGRVSTSNTINTPTGYTSISRSIHQAIEGYNFIVSSAYVIPTGKILKLSKFYLLPTQGYNYGELYLSNNGLWDSNVQLLSYSYGQTINTNTEILGDGTKAIFLKACRKDKGKQKINLVWEGFIED